MGSAAGAQRLTRRVAADAEDLSGGADATCAREHGRIVQASTLEDLAMPPRRRLLAALSTLPTLGVLASLAGCATLGADPPKVHLAGLESLPGEGLELRFMARLRVQNPRDEELVYDGISLDLDLRGQPFASGVGPVAGRVPRFGETVINLPVTVSGFAIARQLWGLVQEGEQRGRIATVPYTLRGRLGGPLGGVRFVAEGEVDLRPGSPGTPPARR